MESISESIKSSVYFLFYMDSDSPTPFDWQSIMVRADQIISMYQWKIVIVDPMNHMKNTVSDNPLIVRSLNEALEHPRLKDLTWVWLHPRADRFLQDYVHPDNNVIYCVGSDEIGFDSQSTEDLSGDVLRVWTPDSNREYYAETVLQIVVYDRALKLWTK